MVQNHSEVTPFSRIPTGVKGLDTLLNGGFLSGGVYLIMGPPGSGKTIIANQLGFNHASSGGRTLYVTLLAETHSRMFGNLKPLRFFNEELISENINYIGAYQVLEREGLDGLLKALGAAVRKFKASMLLIDGIASAEDIASTPLMFKKFVHQLNSVLSTSGCTTFLLSSLDGSLTHPEHTMVDGIVSLTLRTDHMRTTRMIEVKKFRGSAHLHGSHFFKITDDGFMIFPRLESYLGKVNSAPIDTTDRKVFGNKKLDALLGGGLVAGTMTSLLGPAGSGKTLLGATFLEAGANAKEPGLYFSFYESPERLRDKLSNLGVDLNRHVKSGLVEAVWNSRLEHTIDEVGERLIDMVRRKKIKRVFLDGIGGLREGMFDTRRMHPALAAIANELRERGVTTIFTEETELFATEISSPISDLSVVTDNIIFVRQVEIKSEMRRLISVIKTRESSSDRAIHEFEITKKGIVVCGKFKGVQAVMSGLPSVRRGGP